MFRLIFLTVLISVCSAQSYAENYLIREDRIWTYNGDIPVGPYFEFKMRFEGDTLVDGKRYNILHTFDGFTREAQEEPREAIGTNFLMREEDKKIYCHAPLDVDNTGSHWETDESEALLYDFNVESGNDITVISNNFFLTTGYVDSTYFLNIAGESCKAYDILYNGHIKNTIIQGIGSIEKGCLPIIITTVTSGGGGNVKTHILPPMYTEINLKTVTDIEGNVICKKDSEGRWPWEAINSVAEVETGSPISFDGKSISAGNETITLYTISREVIAKGFSKISIDGLQPGVYVAKAGSRTLKILVK